MFPSGIALGGCAAFPPVLIQKDRLLAILVLEVAPIRVGNGLLVNLRRHITRFLVVISDLKKQLVPYQRFGASPASLSRSQVKTPLLSV
jgi:hypothetical protein